MSIASSASLAACILLASTPVTESRSQQDVPPVSSPSETATTRERGALAPAAFDNASAIAQRLRDIASTLPTRAVVHRIGTSREGRAIEVLTLGNLDAAHRAPEILIAAGLDAENLASPEQALETARHIIATNPALLESVRVHVIPLANPDARDAALRVSTPRATNTRAIDHDRDGTIDEDAPTDIDGDGLVLTMRRVAPAGVTATHIIDPVDPRIVRAPNREKREIATHDIFTEGRDIDGDGLVGEDPATGVDLDRNFPHRWPEFSAEAGPYPLSEPESLALAKFVRDHPGLVSAVVFGRHDTLVSFPDTKDKDSTGRTPMVYLADDHGVYRDLGKAWKEATKIERSNSHDLAGSFVLWLANHRGIAAVAANGWARPELPKPPEGTPTPPETGDAETQAWLALCAASQSPSFVDWRAFKHPQLGAVEIGGFVPFAQVSPTATEAREIASKSAAFALALASKRPTIEVSEPHVVDLGGGLLRVGLRVSNVGDMATTTEMGRITGVVPPVVVRWSLAPDDILAGRAVEMIERISAGETREFVWTVRVPKPEGSTQTALEIKISGPFFDELVRDVHMPEVKP
ncbi:MAG: M14 family zinc carboxypeptidase [Limnohabitans sp.]|nr:M14 family zinc carboxypeptidase [Limnohabitans sp.]